MKSKLFLLVRVLMKSGAGGTRLGIKIGKKRFSSQLLIFIILAACFTPMAVTFGQGFAYMYDALSPIGQEGVILGLGTGAASLAIFFFGLFYVLSTFYLTSDVESLLPLPLKPYEIIGAKFIITVIYEYFTESIFLLPLTVAYGIKSGAGPLFYIYSLIVFLLIPVVPLAIGSIIVVVIMTFTSIGRNKDRLILIGGLVAMFFAIGLNISIQRLAQRSLDPQKLIQMLQQGGNSLIRLTSSIFPGIYFAAMGLANSTNINGLINILLFAGTAVIGVLLFLYVGEHLYFRGVVGISESRAKRKKVTDEELNKAVTANSAIKSYVMKEIRLLVRTPIYFMNCVLVNFLWPVFLALPFLMQSGGNDMEQIFNMIRSANDTVIFAVAFGISVFAASANAIAASSISREGKNLYITKFLPMSYISQIVAKALSGVFFSTISAIVIAIVAAILLKLNLAVTIFIVIAGIAGTLFISFAGVMVDLLNPKLDWDSEQKAVKQNFNVVINTLIGLVFGGLIAALVIFADLALVPAFLLITGVFGLLSYGMYYLLSTKGVKLLENIIN